jgi:hypothetical protein
MWITVAAFVAAVVLMFAGVLFPTVGPPVPPTRTVTTVGGSPLDNTVDIHVQPRTVRWSAVIPIGVLVVAGLMLMVVPPLRRASTG